jgi:imidazolonepropionase-like amidohydrolase
MRFRVCATILLGVLSAAVGYASDLELVHATVYTEPDRPPIRDGAIYIHNQRIVAVGATTLLRRRYRAGHIAVYDCSGFAITAGFWNSHVHLLPVPLLHAEQKSPATLNAQLETMFNRWGFTTVFDVASTLANTNRIRHAVGEGTLIGPRILTTGEPFWADVPDYVEKYLTENDIRIPLTTSAEAARLRVDQQVRNGADGIKIFAGAIEPDRIVLLPAGIAKAVVEEAHRDHRLVFSHPSSIEGVELSLDSGVDILAHVTGYGGQWPSSLLRRMLAAHMSLIPTLTLFDVEAQKGHASAQEREQLVALAVSQLRSYAGAGGQILFGTDIGYIYQYDPAEEYELMTRAGMSFTQILASLTVAPAARFGYAGRSGRIAPGMDADLVVLRSDPGADLHALSQVVYTIRAGRFLFCDGRPCAS